MKLPEFPEVELPPLPKMLAGRTGYSAYSMQEYAVEYAEKFALAYGAAVREECARVAADMPIEYERNGMYIHTVPEDYAAAIRKDDH